MAVVACIAFASPAAAKAPNTDTLKIDISASIAERCGIAATGARSNENGRIDVATTIAFNFALDCNTPFKIGVAARNGALQLASAPDASGKLDGFATRKPYTVDLSFMTDQDGLIDAGECASAELEASNARCSFFGAEPGSGMSAGRRSTAIGREGALTVRWRDEASDAIRLAAGPYQEVITIVVGPRT